jgi:hypothetical protein
MTAEMPQRIAAAPGAAEVCFPWTHASNVVAALDDVSATLASQLDARPLMTATLGDWTGRYRDDFDPVLARLTITAPAVAEAARRRASAVVTAAEGANDEQLAANRRSLLDRLEPLHVVGAPRAGGSG